METEELSQFADTVNSFLDDHVTPAETARWRAEGSVSRDMWRRAGQAGLLGVSVPAEYGGAGADLRFELVIMECLARKHALNFAVPLHNAVVAPYLVKYATEEQKSRWLPGVVTGETLLAVAMTEPGAGSDLQGINTVARRDGDHYLINGQKTFISNGLHGSLLVLAAKTDPRAGAKGVSLFAIETEGLEGFSRGRLLDKLGQEGRDTAELFFSDVRVPAGNLLGGVEGQGFRMLMENLPQERLVIAGQAVGMINAALAATLAYVKERKAFGGAVFGFQNTQFKLAECATRARISKVFLDHCVEQHLAGTLDAATASMAKYWITEAQASVIDECLQLFGGYGYILDYPIANMYKDARAYRIYGGTTEIMKLMIARSL